MKHSDILDFLQLVLDFTHCPVVSQWSDYFHSPTAQLSNESQKIPLGSLGERLV